MLRERVSRKKYGGVRGDLVSRANLKIKKPLTSASLDRHLGQSLCPSLSQALSRDRDLILCPSSVPVSVPREIAIYLRKEEIKTPWDSGTRKHPLVYAPNTIGRPARPVNTFRLRRRETRRGVPVSRLSQGPNTRIAARQSLDRWDTARDTHNSALSHAAVGTTTTAT